MKASAILILVAACGSSPDSPDAAVRLVDAPSIDGSPDAAPRPDAPSDVDLTCLGHAGASVAPDPVPLNGRVYSIDHYQVSNLAGATVVLHRRSDDDVIATMTTATNGTFTGSVASGGTPVDAYYTVDATGYVPSRIDPGDPLVGDESALLVAAKTEELARWYTAAGAPYATSGSTLIAAIVDCSRNGVANTTLAVSPAPGSMTYLDSSHQWDSTLASSANGYVLATGDAAPTVTASWQGTMFPPHAIAAPASTLTFALVTPRLASVSLPTEPDRRSSRSGASTLR